MWNQQKKYLHLFMSANVYKHFPYKDYEQEFPYQKTEVLKDLLKFFNGERLFYELLLFLICQVCNWDCFHSFICGNAEKLVNIVVVIRRIFCRERNIILSYR